MKDYEDLREVSARAPLALAMVNRLRLELGQEEPPAQHLYLSWLRPKTQLDSIEWLAWNDLWYYYKAGDIEVPGQPGSKKIRAEEFAASERLFEDIEAYQHLSAGNDELAYDELLNDLYLARLAVKNPSGLLAKEKATDRVALAQKLNIHRAVKALQAGGFSRARRSVLSEKDSKTDIVVPVGKYAQRNIDLRVQPGCRQTNKLDVQTTDRLLFVNIPYDLTDHSPFVMSDLDRATLCSGVRSMRAQLVAFSAGIKIKAVEAA